MGFSSCPGAWADSPGSPHRPRCWAVSLTGAVTSSPGNTLPHDAEHQFSTRSILSFDYYPLSHLSFLPPFIPRTPHLLRTELRAGCYQGCQWDGQGPALLDGREMALKDAMRSAINSASCKPLEAVPFITWAATTRTPAQPANQPLHLLRSLPSES